MAALKLNKPVIAITGSAGKSTTKEMVASILATRWKVFKSRENRNLFSDTRRYARQIKPYHKAVVLEYGMIYPGRIKRHCSFIQPNIGIITMVGTSHIGNFSDGLMGLIRSKSELISYMKQTGKLIINADDHNSRYLHTRKFKGRIIKIGINNAAAYSAYGIKYSNLGMEFKIDLKGKTYTMYIPVLGKHNVYNALFAIAVADQLGFAVHDIKRGLKTCKKLDRRLMLYRCPNGVRLIDDSFSANPNADKAAIDVLNSIGRARKIAVLGSMLELGGQSAREHKRVGRYLAKRRIHYICTYGKEAKNIGYGAAEAGLPARRVSHFTKKALLNRHVVKLIRPRSTVLVKGSHDLRLHGTVAYCRAHLKRQ